MNEIQMQHEEAAVARARRIRRIVSTGSLVVAIAAVIGTLILAAHNAGRIAALQGERDRSDTAAVEVAQEKRDQAKSIEVLCDSGAIQMDERGKQVCREAKKVAAEDPEKRVEQVKGQRGEAGPQGPAGPPGVPGKDSTAPGPRGADSTVPGPRAHLARTPPSPVRRGRIRPSRGLPGSRATPAAKGIRETRASRSSARRATRGNPSWALLVHPGQRATLASPSRAPLDPRG